jgi:hypothetical protein
MPDFPDYLRQCCRVPDKFIPYFVRWVEKYTCYRKKDGSSSDEAAAMHRFIGSLQDHFAEWQIRQARRSLILHYSYQERFGLRTSRVSQVARQVPAPRADILLQLTSRMRLRHLAIRTERAYRGWAVRFLSFIAIDRPTLIDGKHLQAFLSHLAVDGKVSAATQRQAFNALLFLFRNVLAVRRSGSISQWCFLWTRSERSSRICTEPTALWRSSSMAPGSA